MFQNIKFSMSSSSSEIVLWEAIIDLSPPVLHDAHI